MDKPEIDLKDNAVVQFIHHWDCDGMCSAALLYHYLNIHEGNKKVLFRTPHIGNYFLTEDEIESIRKDHPGYIFIIDMALPRKDVLKLKDISPNIYIFDHHRQDKINEVDHINPMTDSSAAGMENPSTGWVINKYFKKGQNLLSVLGAIGDQGEKIKEMPEVKKVIISSGGPYENFTCAVELIDTYYILNDRIEISRLIDLLIKKGDNMGDLLKDLRSGDQRAKIERELELLLSGLVKKVNNGKVIIKELESSMNIISGITRKLSDKYPDSVIVTVNRKNGGSGNIYVRRNKLDIDLSPLINTAHLKGYNAGGKVEVVGIILPEEDIDDFLGELINYLKNVAG